MKKLISLFVLLGLVLTLAATQAFAATGNSGKGSCKKQWSKVFSLNKESTNVSTTSGDFETVQYALQNGCDIKIVAKLLNFVATVPYNFQCQIAWGANDTFHCVSSSYADSKKVQSLEFKYVKGAAHAGAEADFKWHSYFTGMPDENMELQDVFGVVSDPINFDIYTRR